MKTLIPIISSLIWVAQPLFAQDHLKVARSPLMMAEASEKNIKFKGEWIPNSYGGITGVQLDLVQVGTNKMLWVQSSASKTGELRPFSGENFKIHSDETVRDETRKETIRTVILIDQWILKEYGYKEIICYKAHFQERTRHRAELTHYSLTFSQIKDDYEVRYLIPFHVSFPNQEHPNSAKPPVREK